MNATPKAKGLSHRSLIEGVVSNSSLFRGASSNDLKSIVQHSWGLEARRGELLARRNARLPGVFLVAYGAAKLSLGTGDGEGRVLRLVPAGQTFGESTALLERPCRYEARALVDSKLIVIPSSVIFTLIDSDSRFARHIVRALAERCFDLLAKVESPGTRQGAQRLASYLDSLVEPAGRNGECTVQLPATKKVIASLLDMKKETLSRLLRALSDKGLIKVTQYDITIPDRGRLAKIVNLSCRYRGVREGS
jgi:CRP-like cAMP-binding protein